VLEWVPEISLEVGLSQTYSWIEDQVRKKIESKPEVTMEGII